MHCRPSCTQGFVPSLHHLHLLTTATSHQQQSRQPAEIAPRLSSPLLRPPARPREEAVLPGSRVKCSRDQNLPYSHRHPFSVLFSPLPSLLLLPLPPPLWVLQAWESKTHTSHRRTPLCVSISLVPEHRSSV